MPPEMVEDPVRDTDRPRRRRRDSRVRGEAVLLLLETCHDAFVANPASATCDAERMTKPDDVLTEDEVAERAETTVQRVRELADLGLLVPERGTFPSPRCARARVVHRSDGDGHRGRGARVRPRCGRSSPLRNLESLGRRHPRSDRTFEQVAADMNHPRSRPSKRSMSRSGPLPRRDELVRQEGPRGDQVTPRALGCGG